MQMREAMAYIRRDRSQRLIAESDFSQELSVHFPVAACPFDFSSRAVKKIDTGVTSSASLVLVFSIAGDFWVCRAGVLAEHSPNSSLPHRWGRSGSALTIMLYSLIVVCICCVPIDCNRCLSKRMMASKSRQYSLVQRVCRRLAGIISSCK